MNNAYIETHYLDLYDEALQLWRELEQVSGKQLLTLCGLVTHGSPDKIRGSYDALISRGAPVELIAPEEAVSRWPGMRFAGPVLVNPEAGRIHAATALEVLGELSRAHGAELRYEHRVTAITSTTNGVLVTAETSSGEHTIFEADGAVVTAGAWSTELLSTLVQLPPLTVTEEHPAHFKIRPEFVSAEWPSFNHALHFAGENGGNRGNVYGMFTPGEGIKVGFHAVGDQVDPDNRTFRASDEARAELRAYVEEWFPGVDPNSAVEVSCTYTLTESERFVLDTRGPITVGAGFSGQGFKFVPAIGRVLADATLGIATPPKAYLIASH